MSAPILTTKLYIPAPRPKAVLRPRLIEQLNEGLYRKLTLISAPAGFGKTTLISEWLAGCKRPAAWLSLDKEDNDPTRFLVYLVCALQTVAAQQPSVGTIGEGVLAVLQSPQPPPTESVLTALLNEIAIIPDHFILVLDDYHLIDAKPVDNALTFLIEHLPPQMHMVIATREDPPLPLARLRARSQLTELRAIDLRFTAAEAATFLNQAMGLNLSAEEVTALETRTEGWIAGLQLAALALQGLVKPGQAGQGQLLMPGDQDITNFIKSFTGSHRFVLDYLVEEVLQQQPESIQTFLLRTSVLERMCGPLCDAVVHKNARQPLAPADAGQATLEYLERANLFIVPLDTERRWYRYHHLFADLLRQRIASSTGGEKEDAAELHRRASQWYEDHGLEVEAFHHAAAANDVERAARLVEGGGMPLHFRGAVAPVLNWLASLPTTVLDARPSLWVMYASALLFVSQLTDVEYKLQAAEAALQNAEPDDKTRDLVGHIAAIRATLAVTQHQIETIIAQSRRALAYLHANNLPVRTATTWTLGYAYQLQGNRVAAGQAYTEALSISQAIGHFIITVMATLGLGRIQETENQLYLAAQTYRRVLQLMGDPPLPVACEAYLGLARLCYEWNDMDAAQQHGQQSIQLARQLENTDRSVACEVFLARLKLAQGDAAGAAALLVQAGQSVRRHNFVLQMPDVAAARVLLLLHQGHLVAAGQLAQAHELPVSQARVHLAQGDAAAALALLGPWRRHVEAKGWADERLRAIVLQAVAHQAQGEKATAVQLLADALALAAPGGFVRLFVDEGLPLAELLSEAAVQSMMPDYIGKLQAVFEAEEQKRADKSALPLSEPLSQRELEVLQLIAQGLSNREISQRLFLALDTVKGHNRRIFSKLQVQRRTEAVARARELGLV